MEFVMKNGVTGDDIILWEHQLNLLEKIKEYDHNLIISSRQMGMTTLLCHEAVKNIVAGGRVNYKSYRLEMNRMFLRMVAGVLSNSGYDVNMRIYDGCLDIGGEGSLNVKDTNLCDLLLVDGVKIPDRLVFGKSITTMYPYQNISDIIGSYDIKLNIEILGYDLIEGRDEIWRDKMIKNMGTEKFNKEYIS